MFKNLKSLFRDKSGVTSLEYGVLAAVIVVGLVAILQPVKDALTATFTSVAGAL